MLVLFCILLTLSRLPPSVPRSCREHMRIHDAEMFGHFRRTSQSNIQDLVPTTQSQNGSTKRMQHCEMEHRRRNLVAN
uniref:Putative secreted protein n=1 Tax=Ixodes ricinus TaxID=34613 RepID=A0A6B0TUR3_IXORI